MRQSELSVDETIEWAFQSIKDYQALPVMIATRLTVYLEEHSDRIVTFTGEELVALSEEALKQRIRAALTVYQAEGSSHSGHKESVPADAGRQ